MTTLAIIFDVVAAPDAYIATWRNGEIYIEALEPAVS